MTNYSRIGFLLDFKETERIVNPMFAQESQTEKTAGKGMIPQARSSESSVTNSASPIQRMQRTLGNRAVAQLLRNQSGNPAVQKRDAGTSPAGGGAETASPDVRRRRTTRDCLRI